MQILTSPEKTHELCASWKEQRQTIALVPTMGFFHAGHQQLIKTGRELGDRLVVSIFVNPTQFGPGEDLATYPRDFDTDCAIAKKDGADLLFSPEPQLMYGRDYDTWVEVPDMANRLCGISRPSHFRGVCTVVLKLFMITCADIAVFGEKDWQQQAIIKRMVRDLDLPLQIVTVETQRETDGLALSSRNSYLTESERSQAPHIYAGLQLARDMALNGERNPETLIEMVKEYWRNHLPFCEIDYINIVDRDTLKNLEGITDSALMACAVRIGKTRLIDNINLMDKRTC